MVRRTAASTSGWPASSSLSAILADACSEDIGTATASPCAFAGSTDDSRSPRNCDTATALAASTSASLAPAPPRPGG